MSEYAEFNGKQIYIGSCEDARQIRFEQAREVSKAAYSLDYNNADVQTRIRFRFPFVTEDDTNPGDYPDAIPTVTATNVAPAQVWPEARHKSILITLPHGHRAHVVCPAAQDSTTTLAPYPAVAPSGVTIHSVGYQRTHLSLIVECVHCAALWRFTELDDVAPIIASLRATAAPNNLDAQHADRIEALYNPLPH